MSLICVSLYFTEPGPTVYSRGLLDLCATFPSNPIRIYTNSTFDELADDAVKDHVQHCSKCELIRVQEPTIIICERFRLLFEPDPRNIFIFDLDLSPDIWRKYYSILIGSSTDFAGVIRSSAMLAYDDGVAMMGEVERYLPFAGGLIYAKGNKLYHLRDIFERFMSIARDGPASIQHYLDYRDSDNSVWQEFLIRYPHLNPTAKESKASSTKAYSDNIRSLGLTLPYGIDQYFLRVLVLPHCTSKSAYVYSTTHASRVSILFAAYKIKLSHAESVDGSLQDLLHKMNNIPYLRSIFHLVDFVNDDNFRSTNQLKRNIRSRRGSGISRVQHYDPRLFYYFLLETKLSRTNHVLLPVSNVKNLLQDLDTL